MRNNTTLSAQSASLHDFSSARLGTSRHLPTILGAVKESLVDSVTEVYDDGLLYQSANALHKSLVCWIRLDVVVAILDRSELNNETMGHAILSYGQRLKDQERTSKRK
jgi:hypothetical protein